MICATRSRPNSSTWCADSGTAWEDGAIVADKSTGTFLDASKVQPLNHKGRFYLRARVRSTSNGRRKAIR